MRVKWDEHLLLVYSVLAGLAFNQTFVHLSETRFSVESLIIAFGIFFIVLDSWYHLHRDLVVLDIDTTTEIISNLIYFIAVSCFPFFYGGKTSLSMWGLDSPEWFGVNLALICFLDIFCKTATLRKMLRRRHNAIAAVPPMTQDEFTVLRHTIGKYLFFLFTDGFYVIVLSVVVWRLSEVPWSLVTRAWCVVCIWLVVRVIDNLVVPRVSTMLARNYVDDRLPVPVIVSDPTSGERAHAPS